MKHIGRFVFACTLLALSFGTAWAIPTLQLNIGGGWYDASTQTIVTNESSFTLYAYLLPEGVPEGDPGLATLDRDYFISVALVPITATPSDIGSFSFAGTTVAVTSGMTYGVPPLETLLGNQGWDAKDLSKHGIYETYFYEHKFKFNGSQDTTPFNTQDYPGKIPTSDGSGMYYMPFSVDTSGLASGYYLHFDLYNTVLSKKDPNDTDRGDFAPFSHDAQTVPEPGTLILLGSGLIGMAGLRRKRIRR